MCQATEGSYVSSHSAMIYSYGWELRLWVSHILVQYKSAAWDSTATVYSCWLPLVSCADCTYTAPALPHRRNVSDPVTDDDQVAVYRCDSETRTNNKCISSVSKNHDNPREPCNAQQENTMWSAHAHLYDRRPNSLLISCAKTSRAVRPRRVLL